MSVDDVKARFEALSKSAFLDVTLPKSQDFDAAALIRDGKADEISRVPARRNLFFDEQASVLITLKTSTGESEIHDLLPHLEVILTAHATDAVPQGTGNTASASGKHELNTKTLAAGDHVEVITLEGKTYIVWQPQLHLTRPRARLQRPAIYFTANLTLGTAGQRLPARAKEQVLKSCEPLPANILEPLQADPALSNSNVYLSESRITKVAPKPPNLADLVKPIRGATKRAFPAVPALFTRIRYSTLPDAIIASLHLETSHVIAGTVRITKAGFEVPDAQVEDLTKIPLPLETYGGDETILLYKIQPTADAESTPPSAQSPVSISIRAEASLDQGSHIILDIDWQAHVDLSQTWQKPTYRWSRAISTSSHHKKSLSMQSIGKASVDFAPGTSEGFEGGVTFNFSAPPTTHAFSEFKVSVHCNNRSSRSRRFALAMLQHRKLRISTISKATNAVGTNAISQILAPSGPAIERAKAPDVMDLNPDVKIGPLPAGACFETHLTFKALRTGVLDLGTLRIVDLESRQTVDVRELPDVIALEKIEEIG